MSWSEVQMLRLLRAATAQGYRVVQDIITRELCLLAGPVEQVRCADIASARCWLREHLGCDLFARRCKVLASGCYH
jgi:hypothetical protein